MELSATPGRAARKATLSLRFGEVTILRPDGKDMKHLPKTVTLRLVEAVERDPPAGVEPIHWRLLTTHAVDDVAMAWQIVDVSAALDHRAIVPSDEIGWTAA